MTTKQLYLRAIVQWVLTAVVGALAAFVVQYQAGPGPVTSSDFGRWETPAGIWLFLTNSVGLAALALLTSWPVPLWLGFLLNRLSRFPPRRSGWQRSGWLLSRLLLFDVGFVLLVAALLGDDYWANVWDVIKSLGFFLVPGLLVPLLLNRDLLCPRRVP